MSIDQAGQGAVPVAPPSPQDGVGDGDGANLGKSSARVAAEWVAVLAGALVLALVLRSVLFQAYYIRFTSMEPTLNNGDRVLVNKLGYDLHDVHRGDMVVFERPPGVSGRQEDDLIKRVIGLPGEQVEIVNGTVYINGQRLVEPYITEAWGDTRPMIVIPDRHYYVLGDNRNSSQDSRSGRIGLVPRDRIVGKALLRYWPFGDFGLAPNGGAELTETTRPEFSEPAEPPEPEEPSEP